MRLSLGRGLRGSRPTAAKDHSLAHSSHPIERPMKIEDHIKTLNSGGQYMNPSLGSVFDGGMVRQKLDRSQPAKAERCLTSSKSHTEVVASCGSTETTTSAA
ncbi:hypothetical protein L6452_42265 [Arctium lappa]|uniref:Uncharacterized protein n=1 Tax=Arctium lappa TaxID=4217 RepID=A0ACB8XLU5_ARCLA|nr:hypothetical protein L6452_42265 [Arctium lappa]